MHFIGIDPGMSGAIGSIDQHGALYRLSDMPTLALPGEGRTRSRIHGAKLHDQLLEAVPAGDCGLCYVEDVQPWGPSVVTMAAMVGTKMAILAILDCLPHIEVRLVVPQTWKRHFGLRKNPALEGAAAGTDFKRQSRTRAVALYPTADIRLAQHDGRAEALLLAHYAREVWKTEGEVFDAPISAPAPRKLTAKQLRDAAIDASIPFGGAA